MEQLSNNLVERDCCEKLKDDKNLQEHASISAALARPVSAGSNCKFQDKKSTASVESEHVERVETAALNVLNALNEDEGVNEGFLAISDKGSVKSSKKKRRIPVIVTSPDQSELSLLDKRRLSLQLHSQRDKEVDQCRRRLSNVDLSPSLHPGKDGDFPFCQQQSKLLSPAQSTMLTELPEDSKISRSPSASRIPVQRSRSTPPPRYKALEKWKYTPHSAIRENVSTSPDQNLENLIMVGSQTFKQVSSCRQEDLSQDTRSGRYTPGRRERGRTGNNGPDKRRASTTGVTQQYTGHPRARRSLSFSVGCRANADSTSHSSLPENRSMLDTEACRFQERTVKENSFTGGSRAGATGTPAEGLRSLNLELRDQVTRLRAQLDAQKGSIRQVQWQKVLDVRQARQQEQQRLWSALEDLRHKLGQEKNREVEQMREHLSAKAESDLQKLARHKDAEIFKLKQELATKESMLKRVLKDDKKVRSWVPSDAHKTKLLDELRSLKQKKKVLEESLGSASTAQRAFSDGLRKHSERRDSEVSKIKRDMQIEVKGLIEQLKNKDKLISQLEKDLGHQWVSAHQAALERAAVAAACCDSYGEGDAGQAALPGAPQSPLGFAQGGHQNLACGLSPSLSTLSSPSALPPKGKNELDPTDFSSRTPSSTDTIDSVEDVWSSPLDGVSLSKQDLRKALKVSKERNKELVEKCRAYLQRTKELTAQNRAYKDSSVKLLEENKKMQELLEHSKLRCMQLSRQASEASAEKNWAQHTSHIMEQARLELGEAHKTIAALKQACSDKDRRIELIQHRKKRRRLVGQEERSIGGETYFGYEEDTRSVDSSGSHSRSTLSDDDVWDEVMSREETERNYQRLMMEHLQLQKSHNLMQKQTAHMQDPQREEKSKQDLQEDLFHAQCRVERMEMMLRELGEGEIKTLLKEREIILSNLRASQRKIDSVEVEKQQLQQNLIEITGKAEDLEFQLMEMEQQAEDLWQNRPCPEADVQNAEVGWEKDSQHQVTASPLQQRGQGELVGTTAEREGGDGADQNDSPAEEQEEEQGGFADSEGGDGHTSTLCLLLDSLAQQQQKLQLTSGLGPDMDKLRFDLAVLLRGKGPEADTLLKRLDNITQEDKSRREALEFMAHELQMKVIALQQEMDRPQAKQGKAKEQKSSKADNSMSAALAKEKQENLELKAELKKLTASENLLAATERKLHEEMNVWKTQYDRVKHQFDLQQRKSELRTTDVSVQTPKNHLSPVKTLSPPLAELTRKNSKDRKSRPRSGDDPTATKRRRSCYDVFSENDRPTAAPSLKSARSAGDLKLGACHFSPSKTEAPKHTAENIQILATSSDDNDKENRNIAAMREELMAFKAENSHLQDRLNQSTLNKSAVEEAVQGEQEMLLDRINRLESEVGLLRVENDALRSRNRHQRGSDDSGSESGSMGQLTEMEECLENLREQLDAREASERQLRERLRLVESCAEEAEAAELAARERFEKLLSREAENSRQVRQMQQTCLELKDILVDKEIMEQGLTDKVDFLQRAEAAATQRVDELEAENKDLREQLQEAARLADDFESGGPGGANQRELNKIQELKHQMTFLETDNKALQARVAELEENEETLRENWRKVAEVDFSRIQGLEEKVKTLENLNKQLKADVAEAQEYFVINTVAETSLAAELANSQAHVLGDSSDSLTSETGERGDAGDSVDGNLGSMVRKDSEKGTLRDKLKTLERQLSDVTEKKNTTIENLQEKIVGLKENEIKLSETISEMEMSEREIRAKLALYESSEVTVEKMLKYQSKIEELRTSQESLLDQLETMENQEMTLQEKMQEMERTLRGKIVTLEVEIKGFKTRELKDAARIRELEKQEKELSEKTAQQAEKENGLYVKISSLMDELKTAKSQVETLREQLTDKEDKVRKAKLLEVKFLEIEMEYGKKMSDLSTRLRHKEEELRQKEVAHEEQISALKEALCTKDNNHSSEIASLKDQIAEKDSEVSLTVAKLNTQLNKVYGERDAFESQVSDLTLQNQRLKSKQTELETELTSVMEKVSNLDSTKKNFQSKLIELEEQLSLEKGRAEEAESQVKILNEELAREKQNVADLEQEVDSLNDELSRKSKSIENQLEKESELEKEKCTAEKELKIKSERIIELEDQLKQKSDKVAELETMYEQSKSDLDLKQKQFTDLEEEHKKKQEDTLNQLNSLKSHLSEKEREFKAENGVLLSQCENLKVEISSLKNDCAMKESAIEELETEKNIMEKNYSQKIALYEKEQKVLEEELRNKIMFLNSQLNQELETHESDKSALHHSSQREHILSQEVTKHKKDLASHKKDLVDKLSELEDKNKELCELQLQLSNTKHACESLRHEFESFKETAKDLETNLRIEISEKEKVLGKLDKDLHKAKEEKQKIELELTQKQNLMVETSTENMKLAEEKHREISKLLEENAAKEQLVQEHIQKSESTVLQCKQEHQTEVDRLQKKLEEESEKSIQLQKDKQELDDRVEDLKSQIQTLELYLSEVNFKLDSKSSQCRKREEELEAALGEQEKSINEIKTLNKKIESLQKKLNEKEKEISQKASESQSLVSSKQQELENSRTELKKSLKDIEHYKRAVENNEKELAAKDHDHQAALARYDELRNQYHEKDLDYKQLESKLTGYESKLEEADNRYRELETKCINLENQLEERSTQALQGENILQSKEVERLELIQKLSELEEKFETITQDLEIYKIKAAEKEEECKHLEASKDEIQTKVSYLEQSIIKRETECEEAQDKYKKQNMDNEELKIQLADYQTMLTAFEETKGQLVKAEKELNITEDCNKQLKEKLAGFEDEVLHQNQQMVELRGKLQILHNTLEERETSHKDNESGLQTLEQQLLETKIECQNLNSKVTYFQDMCTRKQSLQDQSEKRLQEVQLILNQCQAELLETQNLLSDKDAQHNNVVSELDNIKQLLMASQEELRHMSEKIVQQEQEIVQLQTVNFEVSGSESALKENITEHLKVRSSLEDEVKRLREQTSERERKVYEATKAMENLNTEKNVLQEKIMTLEGNLSLCQNKLCNLEEKNASLAVERDQYMSRLDSLEEEKFSLKEQLNDLCAKNGRLETDIFNLKQEVDVKVEEKCSLEKAIQDQEKSTNEVKSREKEQKEQMDKYYEERHTLESRLREAESMCRDLKSDLDAVNEEMSSSSQNMMELEDQLKEKSLENEVLKSNLLTLEHKYASAVKETEYLERVKALQNEIEMFKKSDIEKEEKLHLLETEFKSVKEQEHRVSQKVVDLENKEKELLQQMADIEVTVIVPLETENQDLKDEIGIVKQERDEALANFGNEDKDSYEEDVQQAVEHAHKRLNDALMQNDELEKKVSILLEDIGKLEAERDLMSKKISDLHTSVEDMAEKCEVAEMEVERLKDLERQTSVVEEAETSLMDQVLDLEAREFQLSQELQVLKQRELTTVGTQTEDTQNLTEKLQYLEQKVEVLQDAEGRYMDTIFELEEAKASLQTKLNENKTCDTSDVSLNTVSSNINSPSASNVVKSFASINLGQSAQESCRVESSYTSNGAVTAATESAVNTSNVKESDRISQNLNELSNQNQELAHELEEKSQNMEQLRTKLELLQDSEARLMERLLEVEEGKSQEMGRDSDLHEATRHTIETLKEENEFLAESVENYKKLYKEEKEKTNALNERVLEDSSVYHDLEEAKEELNALHCKVEALQSDHTEMLAKKTAEESKMTTMLEQSQLNGVELQHQITILQTREKAVHELNSELEIKVLHLQTQLVDLKDRLSDSQQKESYIRRERDQLQEIEAQLQQQVKDLQASEKHLEHQIQDLTKQVQDHHRRTEDDHSGQSDSGMSGDSNKTSFDKDTKPVKSPSPVIEETFSSKASISLSRPPSAASPPQLTAEPILISRSVVPSTTHSEHSNSYLRRSPVTSPVSHAQKPAPVAPPRPRGRRSRPTSIDSISQEELLFLVEELQSREAALKRRVLDLEAITDVDLPQRVDELEKENKRLQESLAQARLGTLSNQGERGETYVSLKNPSYFYPVNDSNNNSNNRTKKHPEPAMLDKPGEVLQQRIKELEQMDTINRNHLTELERDREVLHEIARKDKALIHDLNVKIRELQLSERSLKEQVTSLEVSESSLFSRCEDLDATRVRLEDRVHELEVHERRLRELVRRLKLDEERWLGRSGGMETALGELSASESQLKRLLQDSEMEKGGLAERTAYMEARVRELETVEASLAQKVKVLQSNEANLQKKLSQLENSEAAAHSKAGELDVINADLSQRLQAGLEERAMLAQHLQQLHGQIQDLDRRLLASRDSEMAYKQHVESLQKNESSLQKKVREFELREIDSQARVRELEQTQEILGDKMAALQRSENRLKYRVQELEGMGGQIPGELTPAQKQKVPQKLEDCQKRVVVLQNHVENLQLQLRESIKQSQQTLASKESNQTVSVPVSELSQLRTRSTLLEEATYQMEELEGLNEELNNKILKLREGKGASGHEVEVEVLKRRLDSYKACISRLKSSLSPGQATSLVDPEQDSGPDGETLPARHLHGLESERVLQSVRGLEGGKAKGLPRPSKHGLATQESPMIQSKVASTTSSAPISLDLSLTEESSTELDQSKGSAKTTPNQEESHWRAIEARRVGTVAGSPRGGGATQPDSVPPMSVLLTGMSGVEGATSTPRPNSTGQIKGDKRSSGRLSNSEIEEVTVALNLQSESELSSHHSHLNRTFDAAQNDTDSSLSPIPPPRRARKGAGNRGTMRGATSNSARPHHNFVGEDGAASHNSSSNESGEANTLEPTHSSASAVVSNTTNQKLFFGNGQKKPLPHQPASSEVNTSPGPASPNKHSQAPLASFGGQDSFYLPSPSQDLDSQDDDDAPPPPLPTSQPPGSEIQGEGSGRSPNPIQVAGARKDSLDTSTSGMSIRQRIAMIEKQLQSDQFDSRVDSDHEERWKTQAQESLKQVELLERDNKHIKEDINKLEKELEEKRRHINTLEIWLSSLDDLLKNKNKQTDREMVEQLQLDLTKLKSELKRVGYRPEGGSMDPAALRTELEHRDREIVTKRNEVQNLAEELRRTKDECRSIEGMRRTALDSLRSLEQEVVALQEKELQLTEAAEELDELKARTEKTREVFEENLLLREKVHQGELELRRLRGLCDDFNNLSARYEEIENHKEQAEKRLQPLQAQLERLARKCQQKDMLLLELGDELKQNSFRQSKALDELERMERGMDLEEYNTDFPPLINGLAAQAGQPRRPHHSRSSSMEELDSHLNTQASSRERRKRPTPYVNNRPRSADGILRSDHHDRSDPFSYHLQHVPPFYRALQRPTGSENVEGKFRVIADYDPTLFSQSGRPGLELELVEGDVVTVTGPMDRTGYYEGEVKGRSGLVPANYLLPLQGYPSGGLPRRSGATSALRSSGSGQSEDQSPEHILDMFNQLQHGGHAHRTQASCTSGAPQEAWLQLQASPTPDPPCNLLVRNGDDGDGTFLLSWQPPKIDDRGCNNGLQVLGYMVYVDNQEYEQVPSAGLCQVVLEGLRPGQSHTLAVQALCGGGQVSPRAQLLFQGVVKSEGQMEGFDHTDGRNGNLREHDTDLSAVLDKLHNKRGHKRKVLALYDYSPDRESPGDFPYLELAFQAGDVLTVYGEPRQDGFLHGEVDGKRGLIPACFVENVSESSKGAQRVPASGGVTREMTV